MYNVSVLTAVYRPNPSFLSEAYKSLKTQHVQWQWVIQVDGSKDEIAAIPAKIREDKRVVIAANGEHLGVSATRNLALLQCRHEFVQNFDSDDILQPGALEALANALSGSEAVFAFGRSHNLRPDGTTWHWQPAPYEYDIIKPGVIVEQLQRTGKQHVTLAATMWKKTYIHAAGGWGAMPGREDIYLLIGVSSKHAGIYVDVLTLHYREHPAQSTRRPLLEGDNDANYQALGVYRALAQRKVAGESLKKDDYFYVDEESGKKVDILSLEND